MNSEVVLSVDDVSKHFDTFSLKDISFTLHRGEIMGFIGRNGSGKTTTIKAICSLLDIDGGEIRYLDKPIKDNEKEVKEKIGVIFGGIDFYTGVKIKDLTKVTSRFYKEWDQKLYERWIKYFDLDENKKVKELSNGMKIKYSLAVALSHNADLLLLDEPTSGLDPVSRDELLDSFRDIAKKKGTAILFSTHVISDLEKSADSITYIKKGELVASKSLNDFKNDYFKVKGKISSLSSSNRDKIEHLRERDDTYEGIIKKEYKSFFKEEEIEIPSLEEIMLGIERGEENEESPL